MSPSSSSKLAGSAAGASSYATWIVYGAVAIYAAAFQAQLPVQPFLIKTLSDDAVTAFTSLRTFIAVLQLFGSLLSGWLIDRMGARKVLLLSIGASTLSYAITARATTLPLLYIAQIPTLFQHAVLAARAYMTTIVPVGAARATVIGRITFAYAVGMVVGPTAGGFLAAYHVTYSAIVAAVGSAASFIIIWAYLPEASWMMIEGEGGATVADDELPNKPKISFESGGGYAALLAIPGVIPALAVKSMFYSSLAIFTSAFQLLSVEHFRLSASTLGTILSVFGATSIVGSTIVVPYVRSRMAPTPACIIAAAIFSVSLFSFSAVSTTLEIYILTVPQAISSVLFTTINSGEMSGLVPRSLQGSLHAADMALSSGLRIVSPLLSALLISHAGVFSIGISSGSLMFFVAVLLTAGVGTAEAVKTG